jgi:hypothetical protein
VESSGAEISSLDSTQGNVEGTTSSPTQEASAEQPAWTPNYEFTVKDKKHQIDESLRPLIKSKDVETKLKEIYEKAYGLDEVKSSRETFKEKAAQFEQENGTIKQNLKVLSDVAKKKDFSTFFDVLGIPNEHILEYADQVRKFQSLPAEQQLAIEEYRQQEQAYSQAQTENQTLQQQMQQMMVQQARQEINFEISKPEIQNAAQTFDARVGRSGAFMSEVIRRGQYYEAVHKTSPTAETLVKEVLQIVGMQAPVPQGQAPLQAIPSQGVVQNQSVPVIPAFNGSVTKSPVRKAPGSLQDPRDMRKQL